MIGVVRGGTDQVHYDQILEETNAALEARVAERTADLQAALAELETANRLKDEFLPMISHELRTPLTAVLSFSELLEDEVARPLNERQTKYVRNIDVGGERLLYVINNILGYTHLISGKRQLRCAPCDLGALLHICAEAQRATAEAKQHVIEEQVEPRGLSVKSDNEAIGEVLKRLLDNAIKFTPGAGASGWRRMRAMSPALQLVVWDTGPGLTGAQLAGWSGLLRRATAAWLAATTGSGWGLLTPTRWYAYWAERWRWRPGQAEAAALRSRSRQSNREAAALPGCARDRKPAAAATMAPPAATIRPVRRSASLSWTAW